MSRLRTKIAISTCLLISFLVIGLTSILTVRENRLLRSRLEHSSRGFALLSAEPVLVAYRACYGVDDYGLTKVLSQISQAVPALLRLEVVDSGGEILFSVGEGRARSRGHRPTDLARRIEAQEVSLERHMEEGEEVFDILVPAPQQGMSVRYLISYRSAKQELKRAVMAFGSLALGSICIGVALVMLLSRIATGPLVRLTKASERVREGELSELAGIESRDEVGQVARAFSSVCEELRRNLLKFERANRELQRLDQLKSEFLANVSHELRTPLTSMRGYVDYLLKGKMGEMNEAQRRGLDVVQKNLIRLIKRVESLLTMSKEQMHSNELEVRPFSLRPLLEEVLSGVELESEGKGLVLELDIPEDLPPLLADRERVSQAVENLLSNAVKFTPEGGEIRVSARGISANDKRHVEVSVSDTGIGIPADELPRIFDKFHQADSSERRSYSGIGLGLAIVKQIVDKHHGKIEVESEEGKGTTFRLLLPAY